MEKLSMIFLFCVVVAIAALIGWRAASRKVQERNLTFRGLAGISGLVTVVFVVLAVLQCFTIIPAGNVGVVDIFGVVSDNTMKSGINPVNPLAHVVKFSVQTMEHKEVMQVLSREGLTIGLEISALYHLDPDSAASVYRKIGTDYTDIVMVPQFRSISRAVTASFQASALYSSERERLGTDIQQELARVVGPRGIVVESTPLRNVALPPQLTDAIE
ncbi:MAG TPA: prohibitin family protein, partial [Bacteroidota bacterium]|nr:prohibitin family protein [Bacteroidota bacterium]